MAVMKLMCLLAGVAASSAADSVVLVQRQVVALRERGARVIPSESDILASPTAVLAKMNNETEQLAREIAAAESKSQEHVAALKAKLAEGLAQKRAEVKATEEKNRELQVKTSALSKLVETLHADAKKQRQNHGAMLGELAKLRGDLNVSVAFLDDMLKASQGVEQDAEVSVLFELDSKDEKERKALENAAWRKSLQVPLSLLQESPGYVAPEDATKVLSSMALTLEDISSKRSEDERALRAEFGALVARQEEKKAELLAEQSQLNETLQATQDVVNRLEQATAFLSRSNMRLHGKVVALRRYVGHLAPAESKPTVAAEATSATAPSLLQIAADELPDPLETPLASYVEVGNRVSSLQDNLKNMRMQQADEIKAKKSELDAKLHQQLMDTQLEEKKNSELAKEIEALNFHVDELRETTSEHEATNEELRTNISKMQANLSIAMEFLRAALNESAGAPENTPELAVLSELDLAEAKENATRAAEARMADIDSMVDAADYEPAAADEPAAALLQLRSAAPDGDATMVLGTLASSLETSSQEQSTRLASLQALFNQAWERGAQHRDRVLTEQARLNSTAAASKDLIAKLSEAEDHLAEIGSKLKRHHDALSAFMRHVAARKLPGDIVPVEVPKPANKKRVSPAPPQPRGMHHATAKAKSTKAEAKSTKTSGAGAGGLLSYFFRR